MTLHRMFHKMRFKPGDILIVRGATLNLMERIRRIGKDSGIKFGVPIIQVYERADLRKLSFEQIERAYKISKIEHGKLDYSDLRAEDPGIKKVLMYARAVNVHEPEFSAIKKILEEGADGRYLRKVEDLRFAEPLSADLVVAMDTASSSPSTEQVSNPRSKG